MTSRARDRHPWLEPRSALRGWGRAETEWEEFRGFREDHRRARGGQIRTVDDFPDDNWRKDNPRFIGENFRRNLALVDEVRAIGAEIGATPAQTALAWILARGNDIAPIPGTRRVERMEENTAADRVELSTGQIERLESLQPAAGDRHNAANMASIDR